MHRVDRSSAEPEELQALRLSGAEDFGPLGPALRDVFSDICAYCERGLWSDEHNLINAVEQRDFPAYFTCDHFEPRHRLCYLYNQVGQCGDHPPPHADDCGIYDWDNLLLACNSCNHTKGGQWPLPRESADAYVDPCAESGQPNDPDLVFRFDIESGRMLVTDTCEGIERNNAQRTINDLALNTPRGPRRKHPPTYSGGERRERLEDIRRRYAIGVQLLLDGLDDGPARTFLMARLTARGSHFFALCRQIFREYLS